MLISAAIFLVESKVIEDCLQDQDFALKNFGAPGSYLDHESHAPTIGKRAREGKIIPFWMFVLATIPNM